MKIGVVGFSEGNGHPFSFSSILNGFDEEAFASAGWPGILRYLKERHPSEFSRHGATVSAAWMPSPAMTDALCGAARIERACSTPDEMLGLGLDAVMILRDDAGSHRQLAEPFLRCGIPTFIDKPLATSVEDLRWFRTYLDSGLLMSTAGLRYARELDDVRSNRAEWGGIKLMRATVLLDWERYGIHMLEASLGVVRSLPVSVVGAAGPDRVAVRLEDGCLIDIACLGHVPKLFRLDVCGEKKHSSVDIGDNFSAFSRVIGAFVRQVETRQPAISPDETVAVIKTIIAGRIAINEARTVHLTEVNA